MASPLPSVARTLSRALSGPRIAGLRCTFATEAATPPPAAAAPKTESGTDAAPSGGDKRIRRTAPPDNNKSPGGRMKKKGRASYQYRSPRYYRGPFAPIQPPPPTDPASREFVPGPFTSERLADHYWDTLRADILNMTYEHRHFGFEPPRVPERLRSWDDSSPYHKNRPLRGPRGGTELPLLDRMRTFRNVPKLEGVVVHTMVKQALDNPAYIAVAGTVIQAITGVRAEITHAKKGYAPWGLAEGKPCGAKAIIKGPQAYRFLSSLIDVVMPRIKDYQGIKGSTGDGHGNISFGFPPSAVQLFPEIEVNYDMYPPKMIPGCHVTILTSATNNEDGRLLVESFGIPIYGKRR